MLVNNACGNCLEELGLWNSDLASQPSVCRWYCASLALDLAVLSFSGTHSEPFSQYFKSKPSSFDLPGPLALAPTQITLRPRHFQCLDNFFDGKPAWVFHPNSLAKVADEPLYLPPRCESLITYGVRSGTLPVLHRVTMSGVALSSVGNQNTTHVPVWKRQKSCAIGFRTEKA